MQFHIDSMMCGGCAKSVTQAIRSVDPQAQVAIDLPQKRVSVESVVDAATIMARLEHAGYMPRDVPR